MYECIRFKSREVKLSKDRVLLHKILFTCEAVKNFFLIVLHVFIHEIMLRSTLIYVLNLN